MKNAERVKGPLFYIYQIYKYIVVFPVLGVTTAFFGTMAAAISVLINERAASICGILWGRINACITPIFVTMKGLENIDKHQSYIIISNHQSLFDILLVYGWLPIDFRWVMKIELRKVPFLGYGCYKMGHVLIDRKDRASALSSINNAKKKITNGTSIMFFPEGTRSDDGRLIDFKKGAFHLALDLGLPLLPITIVGTKDIVPNKTIDLFPGPVKLIIHTPIDTGKFSHDHIDLLVEEGKRSIQKGLDENQ